MLTIILASSSPARKKQLSQLGIDFEVISPDIDETPLPNEKADDMVLRLAKAKALKVANDYPDSWVIGCDQVAEFENTIYGKPYCHERALEVLTTFSGNTVVSKTGICLMNLAQEKCFTAIEPYSVTFRDYSIEQADQYLKIEKPYYSAGSINVDGLGVSLVSAYHGRDYNSLIGLPLIALIDLFLLAGVDVLSARSLAIS
jgi:septum formation protein